MLLLIILFSLIGGVFSLAGGVFLLIRKSWSQAHLLTLTSFSAGVLLTFSFADLLPEALEISQNLGKKPDAILFLVLASVILLFIFERSFVWVHCHHDHCEDRHDTLIPLIWLGDTIHNFVDGIVIAASFLISVPLGITTSLAVAAHEIPQEMADFSLFLSRGVRRQKVLILNIISAFSATLGAVLSYLFWDTIFPLRHHLLALAAGMFIYIASSDLMPQLHRETTRRRILPQTVAFLVGVLGTYLLVSKL